MRLPVDHLLGQRMKAPLMKRVNGIGLLNLIREHGPISRAGLAKLSHLSKPTVSSLVEGLMRRDLVVEEGPGQSGARGGKIPTLLKFNAATGLLAAVEVGSDYIRAALTDLEGEIVDRQCQPTRAEEGAGAVLGRVEQTVRDLVARARGRRSRLRLVAVATSGRVNARRGLVLETGNVFNWRDVAVRERLEPLFKVPVFVDNDVNVAALGELHHGAAAGERDFVLVRLGTGIGCGVVLGGRVYHGANWAAGEIAHAVLAESAANLDHGPRGFLENLVGEDRVLAAIRESGLGNSLESLFSAAAEGNAPARHMVDGLGRHLGLAIAMICAAYDPPLLVLQGRLFQLLFQQVVDLATRVIPWGIKVSLSTLDDEAVLLGTIIFARSHAYERLSQELNA